MESCWSSVAGPHRGRSITTITRLSKLDPRLATMNYRWLISSTVRHATSMRKHVRNMLNAQRDILAPQAIENVSMGLVELNSATHSNISKADLLKQMEKLEEVANKWLKPYPHAAYRENIEVFLVALAVAMGIRTFFVQPFKIPTGSMQPTLFGINSVPDFSKVASEADLAEQIKLRDSLTPSKGFDSVKEWFGGTSYLTYKAEVDGPFNGMSRPVRFLLFNLKQTIWVAGQPHNLWFPPDSGGSPSYRWGNILGYIQAMFSPLPIDEMAAPDFERRMGLRRGQVFAKGDEILKLKVVAGDHLFVDRLTYNFRPPQRGEIAVFQTGGIQHSQMPQDQFYIKRLVGLGGDKIQIGDDRHLIINGQRLDQTTRHFEGVYSFDPARAPHDSEFSGHVNNRVGAQYGRPGLAPLFPNEQEVRVLPSDQLMVMGDNTMNSFDSRGWGSFPATNVIGKQFFVYWPLTKRFGWGNK